MAELRGPRPPGGPRPRADGQQRPRAADRYGSRAVDRYGSDVLATPPPWRRPVPEVVAEPGLVVETSDGDVVGAVVGCTADVVTLEDRHGRRRLAPLLPGGFLLEGRTVTLVRPRGSGPTAPSRTRAGAVAAPRGPAKVARASRIWVEGAHDGELLEKVWGDDLRAEGVVVEPLGGVDDLAEHVRAFRPTSARRLGVLVDHLVPGSKESRIAASVTWPHVLVTGHPYVDVWEAVRPRVAGLDAWPRVPRGQPWKEGVCAALGVAEPAAFWRSLLRRVDRWTDLETPLLTAVEQLVDFVCEPAP